MRETIVRPLGLVTSPNKYGVYPAGALSRADNCVLRDPAQLTQLQDKTTLSSLGGLGASVIHRLTSTTKQLVAVTAAGIYWIAPGTGIASSQTFEDTATTLAFGGTGSAHSRIVPLLFRGRTLIPSNTGVVAADYTDPSSGTERAFRWAGLPQPLCVFVSNTPGFTGQALGPNDVVSYSAVIRRTYSDGYELISEPAPILRYKNCTATDTATQVTVAWGAPVGRAGVRAGDIVELYRSTPVDSASSGLDTATPVDVYLVASRVVDAGDVLAHSAVVSDSGDPDSLSRSLYTNPGQEAAQAIRRQPPVSQSISTLDNFAFYSNLTYAPQWIAGFPGGLGTLTTPSERAKGIGKRRIGSGTFTLGSPTITAIAAADLVGVVAGQWIGGPFLSAVPTFGVAKVLAVGATTITMTVNAAANGVTALWTFDSLELDGTTVAIPDIGDWLQFLRGGSILSNKGYSLTTLQTISYVDGNTSSTAERIYQTVFDQRMLLEPSRFAQGSLTVRGTNGANYDPPIPDLTSAAQTYASTRQPNLTAWSWNQQPEAFSPGNYTPVGAGEIYATVATRDAIYYFCSDGLWRLTGYGTRSSGVQANFRVDLIDRTLIIADPHAYCVLRDVVYAFTNRGLVAIEGSMPPAEITTDILQDVLPGRRWLSSGSGVEYVCVADEDRNEVWLVLYDAAAGTSVVYIYNAQQGAFTQCTTIDGTSAGVYADMLGGPAFALRVGPTAVWFDPASSLGSTMTVDFQPIHANDPLTTKQWIDMTVMFSSDVVGRQTQPRYNGVTLAVFASLIARANDARFNFGVPRSAPAIGATLAPGFVIDGDSPLAKLRGISLRHEVLSDQQVFR